MHFAKAVSSAAVAALLPMVLASAPVKAAPLTETFDFTLTGVAANGSAAGLQGSGTITATETTGGAWIVDSATGSLSQVFNGVTVSGTITGLNTDFLGDDELIFPGTTSLVDDHGIGFELNGGQPDAQAVDIANDGVAGGLYTVESTNTIGTDTFTLTAAVPEPSTWAMMILGFCGIGFLAYRKQRISLRIV